MMDSSTTSQKARLTEHTWVSVPLEPLCSRLVELQENFFEREIDVKCICVSGL